MDSFLKITTGILAIPFMFLIALAFAWIPMLAWNNAITVIFDVPAITYGQAFWLDVALSYTLTRFVPIKSIEKK